MEEEQDIQSDIVKQKQLRDAQENKEFDREMDAYRRGRDLTDEQRKERLLDNAKLKGNLMAAIGFEGGIGVATDIATSPLLISPIPGSRPLYYGINYGVGYLSNLVAQKIRGEQELSQGEALAAGGFQTIPFGTTAKGFKGLSRAVTKGAAGGVVGEQVRVGIDEQRLLTPEEAATGAVVGGAFGGAVKGLSEGTDVLKNNIIQHVENDPYSKLWPYTNRLGITQSTGTVGAMRTPRRKQTTPEKYAKQILADEPITKGREPRDYTVFELDLATRGSGIEGQGMPYDAEMRRRVEKLDYDLITELNLKYGGTREQAEEFLIYQKFAKKQVDEAVHKLNQRQRKLQIEDLKLQVSEGKIPKSELKAGIRKINNTTYYNLGHIRSAKNVWRYEKLLGANRASNVLPELEPNVEIINKVTGKRERILVHGNKSRGARMDIPDEILQMTGTSATIDEEYLKFIDPTISEMSYELMPTKLQDELLNSVEEKWLRFRSAGYSDFADYLQEVEGLSWYQFNRLPKNRIKSKKAEVTQNELRAKFNAQKEIISGKQQLDSWKPFLKRSVDDFIHAQELKKQWSKLKKAGKDEEANKLLLEIGKLIN